MNCFGYLIQHVANTCLLACKVKKKTGNRFDDFNQNFDKINQNERKTHFFRRILQKNQKKGNYIEFDPKIKIRFAPLKKHLEPLDKGRL